MACRGGLGLARWLLILQAAMGTFPKCSPCPIGDSLSEALRVRVILKDREEGIPKGPGTGPEPLLRPFSVTTKSPQLSKCTCRSQFPHTPLCLNPLGRITPKANTCFLLASGLRAALSAAPLPAAIAAAPVGYMAPS